VRVTDSRPGAGREGAERRGGLMPARRINASALSIEPARSALPALLLLALAPLACATLPGTATHSGPSSAFRYALAGEAGPVVVFENGLGNSMGIWSGVFEPVSAFARAFAYDRAGIGGSRAAAEPRDGTTIVRELRALLAGLDLDPPYILVGHSLGGQYVELYARTHPDEVAGVVFVDARHADFSARCVAARAERCDTPWYAKLLMPRGARSELAAASDTEREIREAGPFPPIPVRVLTALDRPADMPNLRRAWADAQADLVALSPLGTQDVCAKCGHSIQRDAPERVVDAIRSLVEE